MFRADAEFMGELRHIEECCAIDGSAAALVVDVQGVTAALGAALVPVDWTRSHLTIRTVLT